MVGLEKVGACLLYAASLALECALMGTTFHKQVLLISLCCVGDLLSDLRKTCFTLRIDFLLAEGSDDRNIEFLNSLHPNLPFEVTILESNINIQDLNIYKGADFNETGKLDTKIYTKKCDTFQNIENSSTHPPATFKGFILAEFFRFIRNCGDISEYNKHCELFKQRLCKRGYHRSENAQILRDLANN